MRFYQYDSETEILDRNLVDMNPSCALDLLVDLGQSRLPQRFSSLHRTVGWNFIVAN